VKKALTLVLLCLIAAAGASAAPLSAALDTVYRLYVTNDMDQAYAMLKRLDAEAKTPADRFVTRLEIGDFLLDKKADYAGAEAAYTALAAEYPKHKQLPDVLYRLALSQELQEKYLEAAKNYEKVATRYPKSTFGTDALDAIERCFRKNYQDRVAFVDSYPLTRIELDDRISRNPAAYEQFEKKRELLDTMIDNRLLYSAALAAGMAHDTAFVFNLGEQRNRAMFQEWYERSVNAKSEPTEKDLKASYKKDLATKYTTPEKVHGWQIQVATKAEADTLREELLADTTRKWDSVAKQVSTAPDKEKGGDLGLFARGSQPKPIEQAAFALKVGDISQPISTKDGFVILKVTEKKPKSVRTYADVRNQLSADLKQQNTTRFYDQAIADLKKQAAITSDTTAIEQGKDTLAVVNGIVIDKAALELRLNAIPPFYRSQFDTPEGKRRILDNLILEKLLLKESEAHKLWLVNKVVDQVLTRRTSLLVDAYKRTMTTDKVVLDSAKLMAEYKATIQDFKEPAKVHAREITATSMARAEQLRNWAVAGRLPVMMQGRALLLPNLRPILHAAFVSKDVDTDTFLAHYALAGAPALLPGRPMVTVGTKNVPDLSAPSKLTGPYAKDDTAYGFAFTDLSKQDKLYEPDLVPVERLSQLDSLLGKPARPESAAAAVADSAKLGIYVRLDKALPADLVPGLFELGEVVSKQIKLPDGVLSVKPSKKDTAQKTAFSDIAKRFSSSSSRWSGGDLYWLARDDKAHDEKLVKAAFGLSTKAISPVIKLNDSSYVFVTLDEKKDASTRPFSEVSSKIDNKLRRQMEKELYDAMLVSLRARAKIDVLMKESDFVVEPAPEETKPAETPAVKPAEAPKK
jgi:peptidyl-prolyl cis-trans isomerase C